LFFALFHFFQIPFECIKKVYGVRGMGKIKKRSGKEYKCEMRRWIELLVE